MAALKVSPALMGRFALPSGADVTEVVVSAPGFADQVVPVDDSRQVSAALEDETIKAVYANLGVLSEPDRWNRLLEIADTTEINAIVIDVKQDTIYYDTQVPFFRDIDGMVTPIFDPAELLAELEAHGIYSIARMVVFKDPVVAEGRPDLAVRDEVTGGLWRDMNGAPWVNAFNQELWDSERRSRRGTSPIRVSTRCSTTTFDFPRTAICAQPILRNDYSEASRREAITGAVAIGAERVRAAGAHSPSICSPSSRSWGTIRALVRPCRISRPWPTTSA